jgi:hypothetical protein
MNCKALFGVSVHEVLEDGLKYEIDSTTPDQDRQELAPF